MIDGDHQVVLQPYQYLNSLPSKGFRNQAIDSLNTWLKVPQKSTQMIKNVVKMLHGASLMLVLPCLSRLFPFLPFFHSFFFSVVSLKLPNDA